MARPAHTRILIVLPDDGGLPHDAVVERLGTVLSSHGDRVVEATKKTILHRFRRDGQVLACRALHPSSLRKGFEYLGFSLDDRRTLIRNSTLSRLRQRIARSTRAEARGVVRSSRSASVDQICAGYDHRMLYERFGSIRDFINNVPKKHWTFRKYVKPIADVLGDEAKGVHRQVRHYERWIKSEFARHSNEAPAAPASRRGAEPSS